MPWEIYDDGSLGAKNRRWLKRIFPHSRIHEPDEIEQLLDHHLPRNRFPLLRQVRTQMPLMRKLVDLRVGRLGATLYLDSDMLFFAVPQELINWMDEPGENRYLADPIESYAAPRAELEQLWELKLVPFLNSGLLALEDRAMDWDWVETLLRRAGLEANHRLMEQSVTACLLAVRGATPLPVERYRVLVDEFSPPISGILLHYCWHAKVSYERSEWQRVWSLLPSANKR